MSTVSPVFEAYIRAARTCVELVGHVRPDEWPGAGLGDWDLRALVGHTGLALSNVSAYLRRPATSEDIGSAEAYYTLPPSRTGEGDDAGAVLLRGREAGAALGPDPAVTFTRLVDAAVARVRATGPDDLVRTVAGGIRAEAYVATRAVELVVHGHDIASAIRRSAPFPDEVLAEVGVVLARTAVQRGRGLALITAMTGRADLAAGFTVV